MAKQIDPPTFTVTGTLDDKTVLLMEPELTQALCAEGSKIWLNCQNLQTITDEGITTLTNLLQRCKSNKKTMVIVGLNKSLTQDFKKRKLDEVFCLVPSIDEARLYF